VNAIYTSMPMVCVIVEECDRKMERYLCSRYIYLR